MLKVSYCVFFVQNVLNWPQTCQTYIEAKFEENLKEKRENQRNTFLPYILGLKMTLQWFSDLLIFERQKELPVKEIRKYSLTVLRSPADNLVSFVVGGN